MPYLVTATTQKPSAEVKLYNQNNEAGLLGELFKKEKQKYKLSGELMSERSDATSDGTKLRMQLCGQHKKLMKNI